MSNSAAGRNCCDWSSHRTSPRVNLEEFANFHVRRKKLLLTLSVAHRQQSINPSRTVSRDRGHFLGETILTDKIFEIDSLFGIEPAIGRQLRRSPRHGEVTQRIAQPIRVAPEPKQASAIQSVDNAVRSNDLGVDERMDKRGGMAQPDGVAIDVATRHAIQPLGNIQAIDRQLGTSAGRDLDCTAGKAKAVLGKFVAVAADIEKHALAQQLGLVEGNPPGAVGDKQHIVDRCEFDHRHAPPRDVVDDHDLESFGRVGVYGCSSPKQCQGDRGQP